MKKTQSCFFALLGCFAFAITAHGDPLTEFSKDPAYKPVDVMSPAVKAGTALDLSAMNDAPAGKFGRVIVGKDGNFAFENNPATIRFQGTNHISDFVWRWNSDEEFEKAAVEFARAVRAQGYNFIRLHDIDYVILNGRRAEFPGDCDRKVLDRFFRLQAELKRQGVYVQVVLCHNGDYITGEWAAASRDTDMHRTMMLTGRSLERDMFRAGVKLMLETVNPYTGLAWKDDPAVAAVEFYNELYVGYIRTNDIREKNPEEFEYFRKTWENWYRKHYPDAKDASPLPVPEVFGVILENPTISSHPELAEAYCAFLRDIVQETVAWCERVCREAGYKGLTSISQHHCFQDSEIVWKTLPVSDAHTYFEHPYGNPAGVIQYAGSINRVVQHFTIMMGVRLHGRPILCGEYNHTFWNPYQYELPLAFGAYASYQDFGGFSIYDNAVMLEPRLHPNLKFPIDCFSMGLSPVGRAGEFLTSMIFRRGDVAPAKYRVSVVPPAEFIQKGINGIKALNQNQARISLITGLDLDFPEYQKCAGLPDVKPSDLRIPTADADELVTHRWYNETQTTNRKFALEDFVKFLRQRNILTETNRTDVPNKIFETYDGQIYLDAPHGRMEVVTPRTEAFASREGGFGGRFMTVLNQTVPGLLSVSSLDNRRLAESRKMIMLFSTRCVNSGMVLRGGTVESYGTFPVLMQTGKLKIFLKTRSPLRCFALKINGTRFAEVPVQSTAEGIVIDLDTARLGNETTPFFELSNVKNDRPE